MSDAGRRFTQSCSVGDQFRDWDGTAPCAFYDLLEVALLRMPAEDERHPSPVDFHIRDGRTFSDLAEHDKRAAMRNLAGCRAYATVVAGRVEYNVEAYVA